MDRSRPRTHGYWQGRSRSLDEWVPNLTEILALPDFKTNINHQVWAVEGFAWYRSTLTKDNPEAKPEKSILELEERFRKLADVEEPRFLGLLDMPDDDPVEHLADIRSSLKATKTEPGPLLPGEAIYPRHGFIGQYLNYTQETTAPLAYHFWFAIALLGAACRRNVYMELGYRLYANQYLFIVGDTAEGKGIAFDNATPLVSQANRVVMAELEEKELDLGPLKDGAYPIRTVAVLTDKPTPQWLISSLVPQGDKHTKKGAITRGLDSIGWLANEEVSTWLGKKGDVYEGNVHIITALYNCKKDWAAGTIARGAENLRNMCLTVICGSNLDWINRSVTPDMFAGGFIRRCLFISRNDAAKRSYLDAPPPALDPLQANVMANQMATWMQAEKAVEIELGPNTQTLYSRMNRELARKVKNPEHPRLYYYYLGKYNFVMKLAMVLSVNRYTWHGITTREITEDMASFQMQAEDLEMAIELVEHEEQYLPDCFARIGEHSHTIQYRDIGKILKTYHTKFDEPMPYSKLGQACWGSHMAGDWKRRLDEMLEVELVKMAKYKTKGRPATVVWDPRVLDWKPPKEGS